MSRSPTDHSPATPPAELTFAEKCEKATALFEVKVRAAVAMAVGDGAMGNAAIAEIVEEFRRFLAGGYNPERAAPAEERRESEIVRSEGEKAAVVGDVLDLATLTRIGELLRTQNNRITKDPLFAVEKKVRDYGLDSDYSDGWEWHDADGDWDLASPAKAIELDALEEAGEPTGTWRRVYFRDRWEFVTACLTEQGCKDFISEYRHRIGEETRIYAYSGHGNAEWKALRAAIQSLSSSPPDSASPVRSEGWKEIESAPKDGTKVLLAFASSQPGRIAMGMYLEHDAAFHKYHWQGDAGFFVAEPTHWRDLPAPPVSLLEEKQ